MPDRVVQFSAIRRLVAEQPPMLLPSAYVWLVFFATLDVMMTHLALQIGGTELNPIAAAVIETWGMVGAMLFKFALTTQVIIICEVIGRRQIETARRLSIAAVGITAIPPMFVLAQLWELKLLGM